MSQSVCKVEGCRQFAQCWCSVLVKDGVAISRQKLMEAAPAEVSIQAYQGLYSKASASRATCRNKVS